MLVSNWRQQPHAACEEAGEVLCASPRFPTLGASCFWGGSGPKPLNLRGPSAATDFFAMPTTRSRCLLLHGALSTALGCDAEAYGCQLQKQRHKSSPCRGCVSPALKSEHVSDYVMICDFRLCYDMRSQLRYCVRCLPVHALRRYKTGIAARMQHEMSW